MRNSVYKILTAIILLGLLIPVAIPQGTASADISSVTLDFFKKLNLCNDNSTTINVQSNETIGCNVTVSGYTGTAAYAKLQFYISGSWVDEATATISAPSGATKMTFLFTIPSGLSAGSYQVRVGVADSGLNFAYSGNGTIIIDNTAPTAPTLASPANGAYSSTATPTFQWNTVSDAAYYTLVIDGTDNQTCLTGNTATLSAPMTKASHTWTVKSLDAAGNSTTAAETRTICIDTDAPSTPVCTAPSSGQTYTYSPTYTWTASTDTSTCTIIRYVVETFKSDNTTLADNATTTATSYTRNVPLEAGTYYWRVRAYDSVGLWSGFAWGNSYNMVTPVTSYTIHLGQGWNLISLPLIPADKTPASVLSSILPYIVIVDYYGAVNTSTGQTLCGVQPQWYWWVPGTTWTSGSRTIRYIEDGKAYFIYVNQACDLVITGTQSPPAPDPMPQYNLCYYAGSSTSNADGWNMVGFKSTQTNITAADYLTGINGKYSGVYRYAGNYVLVDSTNPLMSPGTGYWVNMTANGTITPPAQ